MAAGDSRIDVRPIVRLHWRTVKGRSAVLFLVVVPIVAAGACLLWNVHLPTPTSVGLLATAGLLSAFLFGLMIQVLDRSSSWADSPPVPGPDTSWQASYLEELGANTGYASLLSVIVAVLFVVASSVQSGWPLRLFSALGIGAGAHLFFTLLMVMRRVFALTEERLRSVRTGASRG